MEFTREELEKHFCNTVKVTISGKKKNYPANAKIKTHQGIVIIKLDKILFNRIVIPDDELTQLSNIIKLYFKVNGYTKPIIE